MGILDAPAPSVARMSKAESLLRIGGGAYPVDKMTAVLVGNSIISQIASQYSTVGGIGGIRNYNAAGWFNHSQALLGHRFQLLQNAGIAGETSVQILARFNADVVAKAPGFAIFGGLENDATAVGNGTLTLQQAKDNYTAMWDACDTAGIRVIQCVSLPRNATNTTAIKTALFALNQWLRERARVRPKFVLIDWYADLASGVNVDWKANYISSADASGLHPAPWGAYEMGRIFAERVAPLTAPIDVLPNSEAETANLVNVATGSALARGTGGVVGTGGTGQVATGWRVDPLPTASFTCSKIARTDGLPGEWQQVVVASGGAVKIGVNVTGFGTTYTTDDEIYALAEFEVDDVSSPAILGDYIRLNLIAMKSDFGVGRQAIDMDVPSTVTFPGTAHFARRGVLMTPLVIVPSTATLRMALQFEVKNTSGVPIAVRVGRIGMYKKNTGPGADVWSRSDAPLS